MVLGLGYLDLVVVCGLVLGVWYLVLGIVCVVWCEVWVSGMWVGVGEWSWCCGWWGVVVAGVVCV